MTLLSIVQDACNDIGWTSPSSIVGNSEATQFLRLLNREGQALSKWQWQALVKEDTITLAATDQEWKTKIAKLVNDHTLRKQISERVRCDFESRYSLQAVMPTLLNAFSKARAVDS